MGNELSEKQRFIDLIASNPSAWHIFDYCDGLGIDHRTYNSSYVDCFKVLVLTAQYINANEDREDIKLYIDDQDERGHDE